MSGVTHRAGKAAQSGNPGWRAAGHWSRRSRAKGPQRRTTRSFLRGFAEASLKHRVREVRTCRPGGLRHIRHLRLRPSERGTTDLPHHPRGFTPRGGIGIEDVVKIKAFKHVDFLGVDINSKFEKEPGVKDMALILQFKQAMKK